MANVSTEQPQPHPPAPRSGLATPVAVGAISPDAISSIAYGPEQILIALLPWAGMAAFVLLLPITAVTLLILVFVAASYRQVVRFYDRAGGAYAAAGDNFGPYLAQVAAAALLIDYVATVAVQCAAGTVALTSAIPALGPYRLVFAICAVLVICSANLLGLRRPGWASAIVSYSFVVMMTLMIVTGVVRQLLGGLPRYDPAHVGGVPVHQGGGLVMGATILVVLRAVAGGSSSLTGVEAVADNVDVFAEPRSRNAGRGVAAMACILAFFLIGVAWLAYVTHATPSIDESPSMLSGIARAVFGQGLAGSVLFSMVQAATAAILFTGANAGFKGVLVLTGSLKDQSGPQTLPDRTHRPEFSLGVVVAGLLSVVLLLLTGASISVLLLSYATSVFIGFAITAYGVAKHHVTRRGRGWSHNAAISLTAGFLSSIVAGILAVTRFTEGAWLVMIVLPALVFMLILRQLLGDRRNTTGDISRADFQPNRVAPANPAKSTKPPVQKGNRAE